MYGPELRERSGETGLDHELRQRLEVPGRLSRLDDVLALVRRAVAGAPATDRARAGDDADWNELLHVFCPFFLGLAERRLALG